MNSTPTELDEEKSEKMMEAKKSLEEMKETIKPFVSQDNKEKFNQSNSKERWIETRDLSN